MFRSKRLRRTIRASSFTTDTDSPFDATAKETHITLHQSEGGSSSTSGVPVVAVEDLDERVRHVSLDALMGGGTLLRLYTHDGHTVRDGELRSIWRRHIKRVLG